MKKMLILVLTGLTSVAAFAAVKGSSEKDAISLSASTTLKATQVKLVQDPSTNVARFVCYYKITLSKGKAYTIWVDNAATNGVKTQSATISIPPFSIYPKFGFNSPIAMFDAAEVGESTFWVMSGKEWSSSVADDNWGDSSLGSSASEFDFDWNWTTPNTWTYYIVVQGNEGETATLHYAVGKKIPTGIRQNPLVLKVATTPQVTVDPNDNKARPGSVKGEMQFWSSNYYCQVSMKLGCRYHFTSSLGSEANALSVAYLDIDGTVRTNEEERAEYNFAETFVPRKSGTYLVEITSTASNYVNATGKMTYWVEPEKPVAKHTFRKLTADVPIEDCRPGNVNAKGSSYFDAIIDEELFSFTAAKGQNYVVETTGAQTNLLMRIYDAKGNILLENTGNGLPEPAGGASGLDVRCAIAAPTKNTTYYVGVAQNLGYDDDILTANRQPVTLTLRKLGAIVSDTGLRARPKPSDYNADPVAIGGDVEGTVTPTLGAENWYNLYTFPARKGIIYSFGATWLDAEAPTNGYALVADVYYMSSGKKKAVATGADLTPGASTNEPSRMVTFTAAATTTYYVKLRVAEGYALDYPDVRLHAVGYTDDARPGGLQVTPEGTPSARWTINKETVKYGIGDIVILPTNKTYTVKFTKVSGFAVSPASVSVQLKAGEVTNVVPRYVDTCEPKDNQTSGATKWTLKRNKSTGYSRTLWANDPGDYFLVTPKNGFYYSFSLSDNTSHAVFDVKRSDGTLFCSNATDVTKLQLPASKSKYYVYVHRDGATTQADEGEGCYKIVGQYAQVGTIAFAKAAVATKDNANEVKLTVKRTATDGAVSVRYCTVDGTGADAALAGEHYVAQEGVLTWKAGNKSNKTITIKLIPKLGAWYDGGSKRFSVELKPLAPEELAGDHAGEYSAQIVSDTCVVTRGETSKASVTQTSVYAKAAAKTATVKKSEVAPLETGVFYGVGSAADEALTNGLPQFASVTLTSAISKGKTNLTAKVAVAGKTYSFKASGWDAYASEATHRLQLVTTVNKVPYTNTLDVALSTGSTTNDLAWCGAAGDFKLTMNVPDANGKGVQPNIVYAGALYRRNAGVQAYLDAVRDFAGYYTVALVSREWKRTDGTSLNGDAVAASGLPEGRGYLTLTVDNKGTTKVAGMLPDGTKISTSVTAAPLVADTSTLGFKLIIPVCCAKSPWTLGGQLAIVAAPLALGEERPDGLSYSLQVTADEGRLIWNNDNAAATYDAKQGWRCALEPIGGWYDKIVNLQSYYRDYAYEVGTAAISEFPKELLPSGYSYVTAVELDGLDVTLSGNGLAAPTRQLVKQGKIYDFANDATVNPQNAKVKIARATGLVSGDFSLWSATADGTKQKEVKGFKHYGILTLGRMNGNTIDDLYDDAEVLTTGFLLKPVSIPVTTKKSRTWNFSKPFDIVLPENP